MQVIGKGYFLVTRQRSPLERRFPVAIIKAELQGRPGWMHDVGCTQDFVLIHDSPIVLGAARNDLNNYGFLQWAEGLTYGKMTLLDLNDGIQDYYKVGEASCSSGPFLPSHGAPLVCCLMARTLRLCACGLFATTPWLVRQ